jgi:hypothetical protein
VSRLLLQLALLGLALAAAAPAPAAPAAAAPGATGPGAPLDRTQFRYARSIAAAPAGLVEVLLDADVLARSSLSDLRVVGPDGRQIPYLREPADAPLALSLTEGTLAAGEAPLAGRAARGETVHALYLPLASAPSGRLTLEAGLRVFSRDVRVWSEEAGRGAAPVAGAHWEHADPDRPAPPLELWLPPLRAARLLVTVDDGDNAPLPLSGRLLVPTFRLRFFHPGPELELLYGADLAAPQYDLALIAPRLRAAPAREVGLGPVPAVPAGAMRDAEAGAPGPSRGARLAFWLALGLAVAGLLALLARLLSRREGQAG